MANTIWLEDPASVNGATGDASAMLWDSSVGTMAFDTGTKNNGLGSWAADSGAGNAQGHRRKHGVAADAGTRTSTYINYNSTPSAAPWIIGFRTSGNANCFGVELGTDNKLYVDGGTGSLSKAGSTTLSPGTWYRISVGYVVTNTSTFTIKVYLNGTLEISATGADGTIQNASTNRYLVGWIGAPGASKKLYSQNNYIDNGTDSADPGGGVAGLAILNTTSKRPNANGTANNFVTQIGAGGSGYGSGHSPQVNERPASDSNGWSVVAVAATTEEYNIESVATGDVDLSASTLVDYMGWVRAKSLISETGQIVLNAATSNISLTSTITTFNKIAGSTTYPAGTGTDIGIISSATATTVSLYEGGTIFAYNYVAPSAVSIPVFDHYYRLQRQ